MLHFRKFNIFHGLDTIDPHVDHHIVIGTGKSTSIAFKFYMTHPRLKHSHNPIFT